MPFENGEALAHGLTFRFAELPDFRRHDHWTYLQLDAFAPGQEKPVGYLRVAFIPQEVGEAFNQERLLYVETRGHAIYPRPTARSLEERTPFHQTPEDWKREPRRAARYVAESVLRMGYSAWNDLLRQSAEEQIAFVETHRKALHEHTQGPVEKLFAFGVNKADVDYANLDDDFRGKGIAPSLYQAMALYLDAHYRITLNAATCQTQDATRCWARMQEAGLADVDESGRAFFVNGVREATLEQRDISPTPIAFAKPKRKRAMA